MVVVRSNQQLHTACRTLHTIHGSNLDIKCNNTDDIVYVRKQLSINSLGENSTSTVMKNGECQNTSSSTCFLSMTSDIPTAYTSKISLYCNGNHSCTLGEGDLRPSVDKFKSLCQCCKYHVYRIRIGAFFECLPCKYFVNLMYCFSIYLSSYIDIPFGLQFCIGVSVKRKVYNIYCYCPQTFTLIFDSVINLNAFVIAFWGLFENIDIFSFSFAFDIFYREWIFVFKLKQRNQ